MNICPNCNTNNLTIRHPQNDKCNNCNASIVYDVNNKGDRFLSYTMLDIRYDGADYRLYIEQHKTITTCRKVILLTNDSKDAVYADNKVIKLPFRYGWNAEELGKYLMLI